MNDKLTCNKYLVVRNFIPENRALDLGVEFGDHCRNENIPGDTQAPNSSSAPNDRGRFRCRTRGPTSVAS